MDWVLIIFGTQVIEKKRPVRPVFPDYLSVSYDYAESHHFSFLPHYFSRVQLEGTTTTKDFFVSDCFYDKIC